MFYRGTIQMKNIKQLTGRLIGAMPHKIPVGKKEFITFCDKIFKVYNLPDMPSYRRAIATKIMHLGDLTTHKPLSYFAKHVRSAMGKQLSYEMIQELNNQMDEEQAAKKKAFEEAESNIKPIEGTDVKEGPQSTPDQVV